MTTTSSRRGVLTVTANPAIDQTVIIPNFAAGAVNRVQSEQRDAGGKGVNVASFLAGAGTPAAVTGFLGSDNAAGFEAFFAERGLSDAFVRVKGTTRTNLKIVNDRTGVITDINFPGLMPHLEDIDRLVQTVQRLAPSFAWVVISGSLPAGAPIHLYAKLVSVARECGACVALDASGEAMRLGVEALPTLIKPNIEELRELLGRPLADTDDVIDVCGAFNDRGIATVAVSMGEEGGLYAENGVFVETRPPHVPVVSTVGAGDASLAGFLIGRLSDQSLVDCAVLSTAFGAAAVTTVGPRLPSSSDIAVLARRVVARTLEH